MCHISWISIGPSPCPCWINHMYITMPIFLNVSFMFDRKDFSRLLPEYCLHLILHHEFGIVLPFLFDFILIPVFSLLDLELWSLCLYSSTCTGTLKSLAFKYLIQCGFCYLFLTHFLFFLLFETNLWASTSTHWGWPFKLFQNHFVTIYFWQPSGDGALKRRTDASIVSMQLLKPIGCFLRARRDRLISYSLKWYKSHSLLWKDIWKKSWHWLE